MDFFHPKYGCIFELADYCKELKIDHKIEAPSSNINVLEGFILRFPSGADFAANFATTFGCKDLLELGGTGDENIDYMRYTLDDAVCLIPKIKHLLTR